MHIKEEFIFEKTIEKSRFICYLNHCENEDFFKEYLSTIRKKHYDATHICSAFICGQIKRSNDDGEPSGTGGMPILNALEKNNLDNTLALVVRYFGGIKLGTGGLIRAYGGTASEAISNTNIYEYQKYNKYQINLDYSTYDKLNNILSKNTIIQDIQYDVDVKIVFLCNDDKLLDKISEYTKGNKEKLLGEEYIEIMV